MRLKHPSMVARLPGRVCLVVIVTVLCTPAAPRLEAQARPDRTQVRLFVPFNPGGLSVGLTVTSRVAGKCFTASLADAGRSDAWRCTNGNTILDPCFAGTDNGKTVVACPASPWSRSVVLLTPDAALPQANTGALLDHLPWALELATKVRCQFVTGATGVIAGERINYDCAGGGSFVIGGPDRTPLQWQAFVVAARSFTAQQTGVDTAWY